MTRDLYDEFLNLLCAKRELRPFFESMPGVITREKLGPHIEGLENIQDRPKANHRLIKPLYFKDSLAEIVQYYFERDEKPSKEELMEQFELRDILQQGNPITGYRELSYQNEKERNFLSVIADVFPHVIKTLRISRNRSEHAGERPRENGDDKAANGAKELAPAEQPVTLEDIQAALKAGERKKAVELWQQRQLSLEKPHTRTALYDRARKDKKEFYAWLRGERPDGSAADIDIRRALTTDWG